MLMKLAIYYPLAIKLLKTVTSGNWILYPVKHVVQKLGFNNDYLSSIRLVSVAFSQLLNLIL